MSFTNILNIYVIKGVKPIIDSNVVILNSLELPITFIFIYELTIKDRKNANIALILMFLLSYLNLNR